MKVSILGPPGCGSTVFRGLLYETLIRMSTSDGDRKPQVVVNAGPVETKAFGDARLELLSGRWPSSELRHRLSGRALEMGFGSSSSWFRSRRLTRLHLEDVPLTDKDLKVMQGSGQFREVLSGSPGGSIDRNGLSEQFRNALDNEAFILLADVSEPREGSFSREERDAFLATIADNVTRTRLGKGRKVHIMVVLTKAGPEMTDAKRIFEADHPRTAEAIIRADAGGKPNIFISWLRTVPDANGEQVPAVLTRDGQVQIDHSEDEYRRLVETLGKIV